MGQVESRSAARLDPRQRAMLSRSTWLGQQMQFDRLNRRDFITLIGGAAAAGPLAAQAEQGEQLRRIGMLIPLNADDKVAQDRIAGVRSRFEGIGLDRRSQCSIRHPSWCRRSNHPTNRQRNNRLRLRPEVILANGSAAMGPLLQVTSIVPIVFVIVPRSGRSRLRRKLGAARRQCHRVHELRIRHGCEWPELLKQIAPSVKRVAVIRDPRNLRWARPVRRDPVPGAVARRGGTPINMRDPSEIERDVAAFATLT